MKKFMTLTLGLLLAATALSGCQNTWHGAGEDVENMGERMQDPNR